MQTAWRAIARHPRFAVRIVFMLALSGATTTAMFAVVNQILLRPPPGVQRPSDLFRLKAQTDSAFTQRLAGTGLSLPEFVFLRDGLAPTITLAAAASRIAEFDVGDAITREPLQLVTTNYFDVVGARPAVGRLFRRATPEVDAQAELVLAAHYWQRAFGGDSSIIDRSVRVNGVPYRIVGIAQHGFVGLDLIAPSAWVPAARIIDFGVEREAVTSRHFTWLTAFGRRPPRTALTTASARVQTVRDGDLDGRFALAARGMTPVSLKATALPDVGTQDLVGPDKIALWLLQLSLVLLAIACLNVGLLLVARGHARRAELATRIAVGATPSRLILEVFAESMILAIIGSALGLVIARALVRLIQQLTEGTVVIADWRVMAFATAITGLTCVLATCLPAAAMATDIRRGIGSTMRGASTSLPMRPLRLALGIQFALAFVLASAAGLLIETVQRSTKLGLGVATNHLTVLNVAWSRDPQANAFMALVKERLRSIPGVTGASLSAIAPLHGSLTRALRPPGAAESDPTPIQVGGNIVEPGYFSVVGMQILAGRDFTSLDQRGDELVGIVNRAMASMYWGTANPVGRCISGPGEPAHRCTIRVIGMVSDVKLGEITEPPQPYLFTPIAQSAPVPLLLTVRTRHPAGEMVGIVRSSLVGLPAPSAVQIQPLAGLVSSQTAPWRRSAATLTLFALLALVFAGLGAYGMVEFLVAATRREIAVRLALGSTAGKIVAFITLERLREVGIGLGLGIAIFWLIVPTLSQTLHLVSAGSVLAPVVAVVLLAIAAVTGSIASRRVSKIDPASILRSS